jgi:hypothetical protein
MFNRSFALCALTKFTFLILLLTFLTAKNASAQMAETQLVSVVNIETPATVVEAPAKTVYYAPGASAKTDVQPTYARWAKKLSAVYDGYAIQLAVTDFPLSRENALFQQFGRVFYERNEAGKYCYMILASNFSSKKAVEEFIGNILKKRVADAVAVEYKSGKRK